MDAFESGLKDRNRTDINSRMRLINKIRMEQDSFILCTRKGRVEELDCGVGLRSRV